MSKVKPNIGWRLRHPVIYVLSLFGHWEAEHEFKTCPSGERWCQHMHWRLGGGGWPASDSGLDQHYEEVKHAFPDAAS